MQKVRSTKAIMGIEPAIGSEWDAGYLPAAYVHRAVRVTVRKDAADRWVIYTLSRKGTETLDCVTITTLPCETCAKALALCLTFGQDYAECCEHQRDAITPDALFDGTVALLRCALGLSSAWASLDDGARQRLLWTARELLDGVKRWEKVMAAWDYVRQRYPDAALNTLVRFWHSDLMMR